MDIKPDLYIPRPKSVNKYLPHQSKREARRRLRQISAGTLKGDCVTLDARYAAAGLVPPSDMVILK